jgi:hypothetical protein
MLKINKRSAKRANKSNPSGAAGCVPKRIQRRQLTEQYTICSVRFFRGKGEMEYLFKVKKEC